MEKKVTFSSPGSHIFSPCLPLIGTSGSATEPELQLAAVRTIYVSTLKNIKTTTQNWRPAICYLCTGFRTVLPRQRTNIKQFVNLYNVIPCFSKGSNGDSLKPRCNLRLKMIMRGRPLTLNKSSYFVTCNKYVLDIFPHRGMVKERKFKWDSFYLYFLVPPYPCKLNLH